MPLSGVTSAARQFFRYRIERERDGLVRLSRMRARDWAKPSLVGHPIQHVLSAASHHRCACLHQKASPGASDGLADSLSEAAPAAFCDMAWHLLIEVSSDQRRSFWLQH